MFDEEAARNLKPPRARGSRQSSRSREGAAAAPVQALDFDSNRKGGPPGASEDASGASSPDGLLRDSESLLSNVVDGIVNKDRERMRMEVRRYLSYASAILSWSVALCSSEEYG